MFDGGTVLSYFDASLWSILDYDNGQDWRCCRDQPEAKAVAPTAGVRSRFSLIEVCQPVTSD